MGEDKNKLPPGATMQIDLDQVQLVDLEAARTPAPPPGSRRTAPPPLPPSMPPTPSAAPPKPAAPQGESRGMTALHIGVVVLVVAVAVVAGLFVGGVFRGGSTATTAPSAAAPSATHTAPVDSVLTIPVIEVR